MASGIDAPGLATSDDASVCWTTRGSAASNGSVTCLRTADGATLILATALPHPSFVAIDARYVYWFEDSSTLNPALGTLRRVPR